MSKYKIKKLSPYTDEYGCTTWSVGPNPITTEPDYDWNVSGSKVRNLCLIDGNVSLGTANTLEEAQAIVDAHHAEQVRALIESLIEFTDEPSQQVAGEQ